MKKPKRLFKQRPLSGPSGVTSTRCDGYDPNDPFYVAVHEAGHAVSAIVLGFKLKSVDISRRRMPNGQLSLGFTDSPVASKDVVGKGEQAVKPYLIQQVSGPIAEMRVNDRAAECGGCADDRAGARLLATVAICKATVRADGRMEISPNEMERNAARLDALILDALEAADQLVGDHWLAIVKVAMLLKERTQLTGDDVAAIVNAIRDGGS